jgi:nicotinate phosphoribosyltransferase
LDQAGFEDVKIFASSDLDEYRIEAMIREKAPIDGFGVGTRLVTGANFNPITREGGPSALQGVYKLVERIGKDGHPIPKTKLSTDKILVPYRKQINRLLDDESMFHRDIISQWDEPIADAEPLLIPIIEQGRLTYSFPTLEESQKYCKQQINRLPKPYRLLSDSPIYPVKLSPQLEKASTTLHTE